MGVIYLLVAICTHQVGSIQTIDVQTMVFADAARCLKNANANKEMLSKHYQKVEITCLERKLIK